MPEARPPILKVGSGWIELEVLSEPNVVLTMRGYAPALQVRNVRNGLEHHLYIGARSIAEPLEVMRRNNHDRFLGIRFRVRKESLEKASLYQVEQLS